MLMSVRNRGGRLCVLAAVAALTMIGALGATSQAGAATQLGERFTAPGDLGFAGTMVQHYTPLPTNFEYRNESGAMGVITSWSTFGTAAPRTLKLKVGKTSDIAGKAVAMMAESAPQVISGETTHEFPVRLPIGPGYSIGLYAADAGLGTLRTAPLNNNIYSKPGDILPASGFDSGWIEQPLVRINVAATMEPDADVDGWGDETQDKCPGKKGDGEGCPPATKPKADGPSLKDKLKEAREEDRNKGSRGESGSRGKCKKGFKKVTVKPKGKKGKAKKKCKRIKKGKAKAKGQGK